MDKEEILLEMMKLFWDTYQELYPEENGVTFTAFRVGNKDKFLLYPWSKMGTGKAEEWYRFREEK